MPKYLYLRILFLLYVWSSYAQSPQKPSSVAIYSDIQKLNFLGSVLYVAAHPDDENTRMISYFSNKVHARTAYLSLTRGDGGQNLIGPELRELLGVIRTNELLQARRIDGGEQFFSRANDFGYSKHPDETLRFWNRDTILKDMVKVIREFRPDIIINRFNANSAGKTHGHHTASAVLSEQAFELAGDEAFKVQNTIPWKPKRLFFNTSWWFYGSPELFEKKVDKKKLIRLNSGVYLPEKGLSNSEIAALSRSMHKSQGFGSAGTRGDQPEYLELLKGSQVSGNPFNGIDTSWNRIKGGEKVGDLLKKVIDNYDFKDPSKSIQELLKVYQLINTLDDPFWKAQKLKEVREIIVSCAGLYIEAVSGSSEAVPGTGIDVRIEMTNRSDANIQIENLQILPDGETVTRNLDLKNNVKNEWKGTVKIGEQVAYTSPYWLQKKGSLGLYRVSRPELIGKPLTPPEVRVAFNLKIDGVPLRIERPVVYKYTDPVRGEVYRPFEVVPAVTLDLDNGVVIFKPGQKKMIRVRARVHASGVQGKLAFKLPESWKVEPEFVTAGFAKKGEEKTFLFAVTAPATQQVSRGKVEFYRNGKTFDRSRILLQYEHIPQQSVLLPAETAFVSLDVKIAGTDIGYIPGVGDQIPEALSQMGYRVHILDMEMINPGKLKAFDAVITGIRAYNINERLDEKQKILFDYIKNGGTLIVQYNTSRNLKTSNLAPYMLHLSRDRVVEEDAKVRFIDPEAGVLNFPNKITQNDFDGWVQERGLYFADKWGPEFRPVLSMYDKGEKPKKGSLLVAKYGKGYYVYTGLSFFRELPAGVPGAYRLLANLIALGEKNQ